MQNFNFDNNVAVQIKRILIKEGINTAKALGYKLATKQLPVNSINFEFSDINKPQTETRNNSFFLDNIPVYNIKFKQSKYKNDDNLTITIPENDFGIEICNIRIDISKIDIKTIPINERGSIKEIISIPDYNIQISGVLVGDGVPFEQMKILNDIAIAPVSIEVESAYLNNLGINYLHINSIEFPQETEWQNLQKFAISAMSDDKNLVIL